MIARPAAAPFWADRGTDGARAAWATERRSFERLAALSRRLRSLDPEDARARCLADERRELEQRLGLTCTVLPLSAGRAETPTGEADPIRNTIATQEEPHGEA